MTRGTQRRRSGFSLIGILISMACIVVLFAILANSLSQRTTGGGSTTADSVYSMEDQLRFVSMYQGLVAADREFDGGFPRPSALTANPEDDTSAAVWSLLVMRDVVKPSQLVSRNEWNHGVVADDDYDRFAYDPRDGVYWDPTFVADLDRGSNVSYAHMPLFGERAESFWRMQNERHPLLGHRGPKDGVPDAQSMACNEDGTWSGFVLFGDGHVAFHSGTALGAHGSDNLFVMDEGPSGRDAILGFTLHMTPDGPILQWD